MIAKNKPLMFFFGTLLLSVSLGFYGCKKSKPVEREQSRSLAVSRVKNNNEKKKMVILTSKGGCGHVAATSALKKAFSNEYDIHVVNPFEETLGSLDFVKKITGGKLDVETVHNKLAQAGWNRLINLIGKLIVPHTFRFHEKTIEKEFIKLLKEQQPDILISVIPLINKPAATAAANLNIPFLLVTLDMDITNWCFGMQKIKHDNFKVTVGFDTPQVKRELLERNVSKENIIYAGLPLRDDFLESKDHVRIKKEWGIPNDTFIIMIMMGGVGSIATYHYISELAKLDVNVHLLACIGRDESMAKKLSEIALPEHITMTVIPFTKRISDLMSVSNLFITKSGPGSINEALNMNLPMIIDYTKEPLFWEKPCIDFVRRNNFGVALKKYRYLNKTVKKFIQNKTYYDALVQSMKRYPKKNFSQKIQEIVSEMIS